MIEINYSTEFDIRALPQQLQKRYRAALKELLCCQYYPCEAIEIAKTSIYLDAFIWGGEYFDFRRVFKISLDEDPTNK